MGFNSGFKELKMLMVGYLRTPRNLVTTLWWPVWWWSPTDTRMWWRPWCGSTGTRYLHPLRRRRQQISFKRW